MPQMRRKKLRLLYAIQGTGNGHVARSLALIPIFQKHAEVSVLISGIQADLDVPFPVKYRLKGLSFIFGKHGGIDILKMLKEVSFLNFLNEARQLNLSEFDVVINDFEPISSLAAKRQNIPCLQVSHQVAVIQPEAPRPKVQSWFGKWILNHYVSRGHPFGFHFQEYNAHTFTPIIRDEVRQLKGIETKYHYTVYLPAYNDEHLLTFFKLFPNVNWEVFSKKTQRAYSVGNIQLFPVSGSAFVQSMAASKGVICGAGFETPAECIFLGKKLLVIPMRQQYEQHCNAKAVEKMGIKVMRRLHENDRLEMENWLRNGQVIQQNYPDNAEMVVEKIMHYIKKEILDS